jgi:cyclomaltodextrinase
MINKAALFHRAGLEYRYAASDGKVYIRLRAACQNLTKAVLYHGLRYDRHNPPKVEALPMERVLSDGVHDWFEASFKPKDPKIFYYFYIESANDSAYYLESGFKSQPGDNRNEFFYFPYILESDKLKVPDWARGIVTYQIFPDRFERAEDYGRVREGISLDPWGAKPTGPNQFMGGNLEGIRTRIPYLKALGVDAIYLTPIFKSPSVHRYDIIDYYDIDPMLGDKDDFKRLVEDLHKAGIKIILDAVFNHCSHEFFAFKDLLKNQEKSRYKDWFFVKKYPVAYARDTYEAFADMAWNMPKLNTANPEVQEYFSQVGRYWIREYHIDGWRIDVANEVDANFWRKFRMAVKAEDPETFIVGEIWGDSFRWLQGDMFDSVMHYPFTYAVKECFAHKTIDAVAMDQWLNRIAALYTHECRDTLWTILDSHDSERFIHAANLNEDALFMASFMLLTFPGAPMLYYGTELLMEGANDPDCRRCMEWDRVTEDHPLLNHYKKLIKLRKSHEALRKGNFRTWRAPVDGGYAFLRETQDETALIVLNTSDSTMAMELTVPEGLKSAKKLVDAYGEQPVTKTRESIRITLPAKTGAVVVRG